MIKRGSRRRDSNIIEKHDLDPNHHKDKLILRGDPQEKGSYETEGRKLKCDWCNYKTSKVYYVECHPKLSDPITLSLGSDCRRDFMGEQKLGECGNDGVPWLVPCWKCDKHITNSRRLFRPYDEKWILSPYHCEDCDTKNHKLVKEVDEMREGIEEYPVDFKGLADIKFVGFKSLTIGEAYTKWISEKCSSKGSIMSCLGYCIDNYNKGICRYGNKQSVTNFIKYVVLYPVDYAKKKNCKYNSYLHYLPISVAFFILK
jgi:hypothetical protein